MAERLNLESLKSGIKMFLEAPSKKGELEFFKQSLGEHPEALCSFAFHPR